jgi:hypothetical protein
MTHRPPNKPLLRALTRPPFADEIGNKGWFGRLARAQPHVVHQLTLAIAGWPRLSRPLRVAFLSDFHAGAHTDDVARIAALIDEAAAFKPDVALFGGDYVNLQPFGGGRLSPKIIAAILARLEAPLGRFAILGNHDYTYGADDVERALTDAGIAVLNDERRTINHEQHEVDVIGIPDSRRLRPEGRSLLAGLSGERPAIILAHDPFWFAHVPPGPHLTLAGHTHGGQFRLPFVGVLTNASTAPMRWTHGHVAEDGRHLYVTAGIGTSGIPWRIGVPPDYAILDING